MGKILVTGGTGFIGREVVRQLQGQGHAVRLLVREPKRAEKIPGVEVVAGRFDAATLDRACAGVDVIIHLVGIIVEKGAQTFERVHVEATAEIVAAAKRTGVSRYIHMSALGADAASSARYHQTKAQAEAIVRASGLEWTIFRPSLVFGPGDAAVNQFATLLRFPFNVLQLYAFPLIGGGKTLLQPIAVGDVAAAFVRAVEKPEVIGQTYELVGPDRLSLREILQEVAMATGQEFSVERGPIPFRLILRGMVWGVALLMPWVLLWLLWTHAAAPLAGLWLVWVVIAAIACVGRRILFFPLPWKVAFLIGFLMERLLPKPPLTVEQVKMLQHDNIGDAAPAVIEFGLQLHPFRAGIRTYL